MPRRLGVIQGLLRTPCPVDPSTLPRVEGGFACADCGFTVVDVAGLTFEELVELRVRTRTGAERICSAYTVDREERVMVRAAPNSYAVIAVAVSVLLAACETRVAETGGPAPAPIAPATPTVTQAPVAKVEAPASAPVVGVKGAATPACTPGSAPRPKKPKGHAPRDTDMLAGY